MVETNATNLLDLPPRENPLGFKFGTALSKGHSRRILWKIYGIMFSWEFREQPFTCDFKETVPGHPGLSVEHRDLRFDLF